MKRETHYFCLRAGSCGHDTGRVIHHTTNVVEHRGAHSTHKEHA